MSEVVSINNLTKRFNTQLAVNNVSFTVKEGEICGLIGRNGAGKTTILKMLTSLTRPTSGSISLFENDLAQSKKGLEYVGAIIENPGIFDNMTAYQNLKVKFLAMGNKNYEKIDELLKLVELDKTGKKKTKNFSYGMKQRLALALALASEPKLLILDEPINGLDPQGIAAVRNLILNINKEKNTTVIISSHVLEELTKIATQYVFIDQGRIIKDMTKEELDARSRSKIVLSVKDIEKTRKVLDTIGITDIKIIDDSNIEIYGEDVSINDITKALASEDIEIVNISNEKTELEEFYFDIVGGSDNGK